MTIYIAEICARTLRGNFLESSFSILTNMIILFSNGCKKSWKTTNFMKKTGVQIVHAKNLKSFS